jgi:hypothetical protein
MTCLLFAGGDSPYFPWPNFAAVILFTIIVMAWLRRNARRDILTRAEERSALAIVRDMNARLGRLTQNRTAANDLLKHRGEATIHS